MKSLLFVFLSMSLFFTIFQTNANDSSDLNSRAYRTIGSIDK